MAISGAVLADRNAIAQKRGRSRKDVAADINFTPTAENAVATGSSGQISVALTALEGYVFINFGDGKASYQGSATGTPVVRASMAAGTYTVQVTAYGFYKSLTATVT